MRKKRQKTKAKAFKIPEDYCRIIDQIAEQEGRTRSGLLLRMVDFYVDQRRLPLTKATTR